MDSYGLIWTHMDFYGLIDSYDIISCAFVISYELMHLFMTMRQIAYNCPLLLSMIFPSRRKSSGKRPLKRARLRASAYSGVRLTLKPETIFLGPQFGRKLVFLVTNMVTMQLLFDTLHG
jgi:hypothetical protein